MRYLFPNQTGPMPTRPTAIRRSISSARDEYRLRAAEAQNLC
jgi:hypothetical protein